jgi:hypothetical protein
MQISPGRSGFLYWTQIQSFGSFLCAKNTKRCEPAQCGMQVRFYGWIHSLMPYRIRKFLRYQGEGGRADPDPRVQICISTFKLCTVTVQFKKSRNLRKMCELFNIFMKTFQGIFTTAPERDTKSGPDSRIRTHKKKL